jgi:hypothetical protein
MFHKETVFVLGAGASAPYGFSTGFDLLTKARERSAKYLATRLGYPPATDLTPFVDAIRENQHYSIDALLERRHDLLGFGKRLIAALILEEEKKPLTTSPRRAVAIGLDGFSAK